MRGRGKEREERQASRGNRRLYVRRAPRASVQTGRLLQIPAGIEAAGRVRSRALLCGKSGNHGKGQSQDQNGQHTLEHDV